MEQGDIRSGHTMYYSRGERARRGTASVVHKSIMRSIVKMIIPLKSKAEPVL
jgi:hypothetical protein